MSFHVIGGNAGDGLRLPDMHWLNLAARSLSYMRMPLFSFISGFVFVALTRDSGDLGHKILGKARRLLLPCFAVSLLFWITREISLDSQGPLHEIFYTPFAIYWFLQATFLIMTVFLIATRISDNRAGPVAAVLMGLGAAGWVLLPRPDLEVFSFYSALYLSPFFMAGNLLARRRKAEATGIRPSLVTRLAALGGLALAAFAGWWLDRTGLGRDTPLIEAASLAVGLLACLAIFALRPQSAALARLGRHSFAIYLFHIFFTVASVKVMADIAPKLPLHLRFAAALGAGIFGPLVVEAVLLRNRLTAWAFLGLRLRSAGEVQASRMATRAATPDAAA